MYSVADDFWDSYFRHKKEMRSLRREVSNGFDVRLPTSVGAKQVPDRQLHAEKSGRGSSYQKQNNSGEGHARHHSITNIKYSRVR